MNRILRIFLLLCLSLMLTSCYQNDKVNGTYKLVEFEILNKEVKFYNFDFYDLNEATWKNRFYISFGALRDMINNAEEYADVLDIDEEGIIFWNFIGPDIRSVGGFGLGMTIFSSDTVGSNRYDNFVLRNNKFKLANGNSFGDSDVEIIFDEDYIYLDYYGPTMENEYVLALRAKYQKISDDCMTSDEYQVIKNSYASN